MAIPWLAVLKQVPWSDVIGNAPKVADGAKKLWGNIRRRPVSAETEVAADNPALSPEERNLAALQAQLATVRTSIAELQAEMLASSELIKELAEQNTQLIKRVDGLRRRMRWIGLATLIICIVLAYLLTTSWKP